MENVNYGDRNLALRNEILRGLVGSTVHGLSISDQDDRDETGIYVAPSTHICGLSTPKTHTWRTKPEGERSGPGDLDLSIYELRHWMRLAVEGNPSILTLLFVPDEGLVLNTPLGQQLRAAAPFILSRQAGHRFLGYLNGQKERLLGKGKQNRVPNRPELVEKYGFDTKYAGHAVRLGLQGVELMRTGTLQLPMAPDHRRLILDIRTGEFTLTDVLWIISGLVHDLTNYVDGNLRSPLPERPNMYAVNAVLEDIYFKHWGV